MGQARQRAYLDAMEIPRYVRRDLDKSDDVEVTEPVAPVEPGTRDDFDQLRTEVAACAACGLAATRTQTVFGVGNEKADGSPDPFPGVC